MNNNLHLPEIGFEMPITDLIMDLEQLRYKRLQGSTHPLVFLQLKSLFQMLESIGSSRIEGNNTTVLDYVESTKLKTLKPVNKAEEQILEIRNIAKAMQYLEDNIEEMPISTHMVRELHQLVVDGLSVDMEGARMPGCFRSHDVHISGSAHVPPPFSEVDHYMAELMDFINQNDKPKYDLLKIAIAHHRLVWIHPFENGNGRVVRLFTYAMLLKNVFRDRNRIINPTAVFCSDRQAYYDNLSLADSGDDSGIIQWAQYMLEGLKSEIIKIDQLCDYNYLKVNILIPSLNDAVTKKFILPEHATVLRFAIQKQDQVIQSSDLQNTFPNKSASDRSRIIRAMKETGLLLPVQESARKYVISFNNNFWVRCILSNLDKNGFLPVNDKHKE